MDAISAYIPQDRRHALVRGMTLSAQATGAVVLADISGFTPLTERLTQALGPRQGAEELTLHLNAVYDALIAEVEFYGGSVVSFAGDAITCWFDESRGRASQRATACALALQDAMRQFTAVTLPGDAAVALGLKVVVASGPTWRFVVGDPNLQLIDTLAGTTIDRTAIAEGLAQRGEVLVDSLTATALSMLLHITEWREDTQTGERFAVVSALTEPVESAPWPELPQPLVATLARPWLLPAVFERERSGQGAFLTEFRPVVVFFLRFVGLDYEQDDAGTELDSFIRRVQAVLARYEGTLLAVTIGDKGSYFSAVFGAPVAHEDDTRRAVKAALDIRQIAAETGAFMPVQIGISRGTMRVGTYGSSTRCTYGLMGDEVNLAARLMSQAAPGEVLISGRVRQGLADVFSLEARAPIRFKGKAEPLPVFALAGTLERRSIRLQEPVFGLPMIGRQQELSLIEQKMTLALQGHGQIVGITAEAGLGKSRLVAEVIRLARRRNLAGYGGACQSDGTNISYLAWWSVWRAFFDLDATAALRKQIRLLEGELEEYTPQRVEALPLLTAVLGVPLPDNDFTRTLEPKDRKAALETLLMECVKSAAREAGEDGGGLLFVLEDLHWMDPASHDLLEALAHASAGLPVLIVLAYRPLEFERLCEQMRRVETLPHFTKISLTELRAAEAEQAIRAKLAQLFPERGTSALPMLIERVTARAQGNPFFAEELLNYMHDRGIDPGNVTALVTLELPASLHSLILSRIDQLTPQQQFVLKVASVIGRVFRFAYLHGYYPALGEPKALKGDLDILAHLDLTPLDHPEPELTYLYKHIVTRDVAYESLAYATRAALHEQFAVFLEARLEEQHVEDAIASSLLLDLLAYHYDHSENVVKKREYLRRAGEAAAARYANLEAIDYLSRALVLTPAEDREERYALLLARETVYGLLGARDTQKQNLVQLEVLAEQMADATRSAVVALHWAAYADSTSDYLAAVAHAQKAVVFAQRVGAVASEVQGYLAWGNALWHRADYVGAAMQCERALALTRQAKLPLLEAEALRSLGIIAERTSDYARAREYLAQALDLFRKSGDRRGESKSLNSLGVVAYNQSDFGKARSVLEQALHLKRELGDRHGEGVVLSNLGVIADSQNDYTAARLYFDQCLQLCGEIGDREGVSAALTGLANAALNLGDELGAQEQFKQALHVAQEIEDREGVGSALAGMGSAALQLGDTRAAQAYYEEALSLYREIGDQRQEGSLVGKLGELAYQSGNNAAARELSQQALAIAQEVGDSSNAGEALTCLGRALAREGEWVEATQAFQDALRVWNTSGQFRLAIAALAELAHVTLQMGHIDQAQIYAVEVVHAMETKPARVLDAPRVYLILYQVFQAGCDLRADSFIEKAYSLLHDRAAKLPDAASRQAFFANIPWRREVVVAWEQANLK